MLDSATRVSVFGNIATMQYKSSLALMAV